MSHPLLLPVEIADQIDDLPTAIAEALLLGVDWSAYPDPRPMVTVRVQADLHPDDVVDLHAYDVPAQRVARGLLRGWLAMRAGG